jgi:hypothetical protein
MALQPKYDIVHEILKITHHFPFPLAWEHVKGHQDTHRQWYYKLVWMETLNAQANKHTGKLTDHQNPNKLIHMIQSKKMLFEMTAPTSPSIMLHILEKP